MFFSGRFWIVVYVMVIGCGYYIHRGNQTPPGSSQPIKLQCFFAINHFVGDVLQFLDRYGIVDYIYGVRWYVEHGSYFLQSSLEGVERSDVSIAGVPVRIYTPSESSGRGMVYYHGGGWTIGSIETHDPVTMLFAKKANMVVISVGYRLNPEYTQQDGLDDCVLVTKYFIDNADQYGVDSSRIVIAGDSAGGNYAAAVSLVLRDEKFEPMPSLQLLIYPVTQAIDLTLPSYQQNEHGPYLSKVEMCWFISMTTAKNASYVDYIATNTHVDEEVRVSMGMSTLDHDQIKNENKYSPYEKPNYVSGKSEIWNSMKSHMLNPYMFPLMSRDLTDLPDAYVVTAQFDPLRDEGFLYVKKLRDAGVMVTHYNSRIGWHAMINVAFHFTDSMDVVVRMAKFIEKNV